MRWSFQVLWRNHKEAIVFLPVFFLDVVREDQMHIVSKIRYRERKTETGAMKTRQPSTSEVELVFVCLTKKVGTIVYSHSVVAASKLNSFD